MSKKRTKVKTLSYEYLIIVLVFLTETQTISTVKSVGTQCDLLDAMLLQRFPQVKSLDDSFVTETEETEMDTSFYSNQEDHTTE